MCAAGPERKLAAILSADVVGYSRLMAEDESGTIRTLTAYREEIGLLVRQHRGRIENFTGDNFLAEFPTALDAVTCAVEMQRVVEARNAGVSQDRRIRFRMGVHLGDVSDEEGRLYGSGVNIAARLEGLAHAGGICISSEVHGQVRHKLELAFEDLGEQTMKNIPDPVRAYRMALDSTGAEPNTPPETRRRLVVALLVLLFGGFGGTALWWWTNSPPPPLDGPDFVGRPAIAVLPFDPLPPDQEYFADGVADALITRLSTYGSLPVIARNSSFTYKGQAVDVQQVGHELGARYVVEGSVQRAGDRVRITVQLIDATTGHHVWAETYDRELRDLFAVQDDITESIVGSMAPELVRAESDRAARAEPRNLDAYELIMRGWWHTWRRTRDDNIKARSFFEQAIERDPSLAAAWAGLALSHSQAIQFQWSTSPSQSIQELLGSAQRAVSLDPQLPLAQLVLAAAHQLTGQTEKMIAAARRAVELNPSFATAHGILGIYLAETRSPEEAIPHLESAMRLSPRDPFMPYIMHGVAAAHFAAGRYADSVDWAKRTLRRQPDFRWALAFLAASQAHLGHREEARMAMADLLRVQPEFDAAYLRRWIPFADPEFQERWLDGLHKAGLPEE